MPDLHLANVYVFDDLEQVDAVWEGREPGYVYGRFGTPNHTILEETLASLEGGEAGLVTASGMGALSAYLLGALRTGRPPRRRPGPLRRDDSPCSASRPRGGESA